MKAIISLIIIALLIGAAGFLYSGKTGGSPVSESSQAITLCEEGTADFNAYRLNAARDKLIACLELDPDLAEASISLAFTYGRLGRIPEYKEALARADSLVGNIADDDRRLMAQLRLTATHDSKFTSIRDSVLTRLKVLKPDNIHVLVALASKSQSVEDEEKAWQKVRAADPNYAVSYNMLGYLALRQGNFDQAAKHMQKYAFLAPDLANPHDSLGDVFFAQGRYEEAEAAYVRSVTMQPDFYVSLINLGKTYLARGQILKGVDILEKVRTEVVGSTLEQKVDREILHTILFFDIEGKLPQMVAKYVEKWPKEGDTSLFRALQLAHMGDLAGSQAVMDSTLTEWRVSDRYKTDEHSRKSIDGFGKRYEALVSDLADSPSTRVRHWAGLVALNEDDPLHDQWHDRWRLGEALLDNNQPELALEQIAPLLEINPRLINPLSLAVRANLALRHPEDSRRALEQAKWALSKADPDFPPLLKLEQLEEQVAELEGSS